MRTELRDSGWGKTNGAMDLPANEECHAIGRTAGLQKREYPSIDRPGINQFLRRVQAQDAIEIFQNETAVGNLFAVIG